MTQFVSIAGMHRSGTSMTSRMVDLLGYAVGPESALLEAKPDNPRGFWENRDIAQLNDDLLAQLGGSWSVPPPLHDGWLEDAAIGPFFGRAKELLEQTFGSVEQASWKDPRTSLLYPFWRQVADITASIVMLRDPRHVAASLAARDGMDSELSAQLWIRYTLEALTSAPNRLLMNYQSMLTDPSGAAKEIADHLQVTDADRIADASATIEPDLSHHQTSEPSGGPWERAAIAVFDSLLERGGSADVDGALLAARLEADRRHEREVSKDRRHQVETAVARMNELEGDLKIARERFNEAREELESAQRSLEHAEEVRSEMSDRISLLEAQLSRHNATVGRLEDQLRHMGMQLRGESHYPGTPELVEGGS